MKTQIRKQVRRWGWLLLACMMLLSSDAVAGLYGAGAPAAAANGLYLSSSGSTENSRIVSARKKKKKKKKKNNSSGSGNTGNNGSQGNGNNSKSGSTASQSNGNNGKSGNNAQQSGSSNGSTSAKGKDTSDQDREQELTVTEDGTYTSKEEVALYIHLYEHLPDNYITKREAQDLGWNSREGNLDEVAPGKSIGGDRFGNYEGLLPEKSGRKYTECDIDFDGTYRNAKRIIFSNDGLIYYTEDHYETFERLY